MKRLVAACAAGFILLAVGLAVDPVRTWFAYLMAFSFAVSIAVGGLVFLMVGYAANARWFAVVRRLSETIALAFPALAILFVPLVVGAEHIYPWLSPPPHASARELELLAHRAPYLNLPSFAVRGAIYFAIWIAAAGILRRRSRRRDREPPAAGDPEAALTRERRFACAMLPAVGLAVTFAAFDWIMSLETEWLSSIFGIYYFAGGFAAAIALIAVLAHAARGAMSGAVRPDHFHALGRLLFAFLVFWAYAAFFQALLIAIADKPNEIGFYLGRTRGPWVGFLYVLVFGHFALPFLALLPRRVKRRPRALALVGSWVLAMHLCDVYWLVIPETAQGPMIFHWVDLAALVAVVGSAAATCAWRQKAAPLLPEGDPFLAEGLAYRSPL